MGVLIANNRFKKTIEFNGRRISTMVTRSGVKDGVVLSVNDVDLEGNAKLSRGDGSQYATARVRAYPGKLILICGYGPEHMAKIMALKSGDVISAETEPMTVGTSGDRLHRLVELIDVQPAVPAAVIEGDTAFAAASSAA